LRSGPRTEPIIFLLLLAVAFLLRLAIISSPFGWLEADEAVVGLMARHILEGERPVYFWGQPHGYLGALEAYCAAAAFAIVGPSTVALKLVPTFYSLGFIALSVAISQRLFGFGSALLTGAYLAFPPLMLALWSVKARSGYAEILCMGEAILLLALWLPHARRPVFAATVLGCLAGLAVWTNPLAVVYVAAATGYLIFAMPGNGWLVTVPAILGFLIGALPSVLPQSGGPLEGISLAADTVGAPLVAIPQNLHTLTWVSLPVLVGLTPPIGDPFIWQLDWLNVPTTSAWIILAVEGLLLVGLATYGGSLRALWDGRGRAPIGPGLLIGTVLATLIALPFSRLSELGGEPRYALPLYAAVPLYAALAMRLWRRGWVLAAVSALGVMAAFSLNAYTLVTADPYRLLPPSAGASTPETRAELIAYLTNQGLTEIFADYWLAYPLAFESNERIVPYVISGGPNRYAPYAAQVTASSRPSVVLVRGTPLAEAFSEDLESGGPRARIESISIYDVITGVDPQWVLSETNGSVSALGSRADTGG
jgi:hypothetical protein